MKFIIVPLLLIISACTIKQINLNQPNIKLYNLWLNTCLKQSDLSHSECEELAKSYSTEI